MSALLKITKRNMSQFGLNVVLYLKSDTSSSDVFLCPWVYLFNIFLKYQLFKSLHPRQDTMVACIWNIIHRIIYSNIDHTDCPDGYHYQWLSPTIIPSHRHIQGHHNITELRKFLDSKWVLEINRFLPTRRCPRLSIWSTIVNQT